MTAWSPLPLLDQVFLYDGEEAEDSDPFSARVGMVALRGSLTVTSSRSLVRTISMDLAEHELVVFDFSDATYIDDSAAMLVKQLIEIATDEKTPAIAMGALGGSRGHPVRPRRPGRGSEGAIVRDLDEARRVARKLLGLEPAPVARSEPRV